MDSSKGNKVLKFSKQRRLWTDSGTLYNVLATRLRQGIERQLKKSGHIFLTNHIQNTVTSIYN